MKVHYPTILMLELAIYQVEIILDMKLSMQNVHH